MNSIEKENHFRSQGNKEFQKQMNLKYIYPKYKPIQQSPPVAEENKVIQNKQSPLTASVQSIPQLKPQTLKQQQQPQQPQQPIQTKQPIQQIQTQQPIQTQEQTQKKKIRILEVKDMY